MKTIIGFILEILGLIGVIWKSVETIIYRFDNPDFTEYRVFIERPELTIAALVFWLVAVIGYHMIKSEG